MEEQERHKIESGFDRIHWESEQRAGSSLPKGRYYSDEELSEIRCQNYGSRN